MKGDGKEFVFRYRGICFLGKMVRLKRHVVESV
jgi:hypothetical protein